MSDSAVDIRAVAAEMSKAESAPAAAPSPVESQAITPETPPAAPAESAASRARDDGGRFAKAQKEAAPKPSAGAQTREESSAPEPTGDASAASEPSSTEAPKAPAPARKPPQSWPAAARERFAALPAEVQEVVLKREAHIDHALKESAEQRKRDEAFQKVLQPFTPHLQALGVQPTQAVETMLRTDYALRTNPEPQKAHIFAQLMATYGVTVESLADAIDRTRAGQPPPQQATQQPQQFRDPRFDQLMSSLQQRQAAKLQQEVAEFSSSAEFYEDVREDMADHMEAAARRGQSLSIKEAYDRACYANPEIRTILTQRQSSQANAQASTQRARAASSSVRTEPTTSAAPVSSGSAASDVRAVAHALRSR